MLEVAFTATIVFIMWQNINIKGAPKHFSPPPKTKPLLRPYVLVMNKQSNSWSIDSNVCVVIAAVVRSIAM